MTNHIGRSVFQDWNANSGNAKGRIVMVLFRVASNLRARKNWNRNPLTVAYGVLYRVLVEWILGIEIPWKLRPGPNFVFYHGIGLVINDNTEIGANVTFRHNVTVGTQEHGGGAPVIGDGVTFGAGSFVLGSIRVGEGAVVAAGAVVVKDVPERSIVAGNPAKVIGTK